MIKREQEHYSRLEAIGSGSVGPGALVRHRYDSGTALGFVIGMSNDKWCTIGWDNPVQSTQFDKHVGDVVGWIVAGVINYGVIRRVTQNHKFWIEKLKLEHNIFSFTYDPQFELETYYSVDVDKICVKMGVPSCYSRCY